jgi:tight adherence protein C
MTFESVFLVIPIFLLIYKGVGLLFDAQEERKWATSKLSKKSGASFGVLHQFSSLSSKIGVNKAFLHFKPLGDRLDLLLLRSGYPFGWKSEDLLLCKEITAALLLAFFVKISPDDPLLWGAGLLLGFWAPDMYMMAKGAERRLAIQRLLPGFIDLTALALESGLDLLAAIERIIEKMKPSSLKDELNTLLQENRLGTSRKESLEHLSYRINLPDVHSLASIIIQSEELGTSLAGVLRNYAVDMRTKRILRAEEIAGKAPVKLLLPMMVFFFPIVFVVIFGPLAATFMTNYK